MLFSIRIKLKVVTRIRISIINSKVIVYYDAAVTFFVLICNSDKIVFCAATTSSFDDELTHYLFSTDCRFTYKQCSILSDLQANVVHFFDVLNENIHLYFPRKE